MSDVLFSVDDGLAFVRLNRPERRNALDTAAVTELGAVVEELAARQSVRAVLITGEGRGFCAGADVGEWDGGYADGAESWTARMHRLMTQLYWLRRPVICAVNGAAVGAGCDLALVADMRIAAPEAKFGQFYVKYGYCPDAGGSYLLPRLIGEARAAEMIYTGRLVEAEEALRIGLVNEVVPADELLSRATEVGRRLASGPTVAIGLAKENMRRSCTRTFEEALRAEAVAAESCARTEDHGEGLRAASEKRPPIFVGR